MTVSLSGCSKEVSLDEIKEVEKNIGISFDGKYIDVILSNNGGTPSKNLFDYNNEVFSIHMFLPIKNDGNIDSLERNYKDLSSEEYYPNWLIPFAIDGGGDIYGFSKRSYEMGAVYCFMMDYYDDPDESLIKLSESFSYLVNSLYEESS